MRMMPRSKFRTDSRDRFARFEYGRTYFVGIGGDDD